MRTAALLVGGVARRLGGRPKALLRVGGVPLLDRLSTLLGDTVGPVTLIGDPQGPYATHRAPIRPDVLPGRGAPGGLHAALHYAPSGWVFVTAGDMPHLDAATINTLIAHLGEQDAVLPMADRLQPLAGFWHTRCIDKLAAHLGDPTKVPGFRRIISTLQITQVPFANAEVFRSVNTPEDVAALDGQWV